MTPNNRFQSIRDSFRVFGDRAFDLARARQDLMKPSARLAAAHVHRRPTATAHLRRRSAGTRGIVRRRWSFSARFQRHLIAMVSYVCRREGTRNFDISSN